MADLHVGFTGTQRGMTEAQRAAVEFTLRALRQPEGRSLFHHGDCIGSDAQAAEIARTLGYELVCHPPEDPKKRAFVPGCAETREPKPYLVRNRDIARESEVVLATPETSVEKMRGSGTWATVRYAERLGRRLYAFDPEYGALIRR